MQNACSRKPTRMYEVGFHWCQFSGIFCACCLFCCADFAAMWWFACRVGFTHITVPFYQQIIKNLTVLPLLTVYCKWLQYLLLLSITESNYPEVLNSAKSHLEHIRRVHKRTVSDHRSQQNACPECAYVARSNSKLDLHVGYHKLASVFRCNSCNYLTPKRDNISRHTLTGGGCSPKDIVHIKSHSNNGSALLTG